MALTITHNQVAGTGADPDAVIDGDDWDAEHVITGSVAATEITGTEWAITGSSNAVIPNLSGVSLELTNTSDALQFIGGDIRFGTVAGDPYAVIKSELVTGPSPYRGDIVFATKTLTSDPLTVKLRLLSSGSLLSGTANSEVSGSGNYIAVNDIGFQNFLGYTHNVDSPQAVNASGYFIADNDADVGESNTGGWGVYGECRVRNHGAALGAELDAQNLSGVDARDINPNEIFGTDAAKPWCISIITQPTASDPGTSYDISAALLVADSGAAPGSPAFRSGIVIDKDAIQTVSGHKVALALGTGHEIVWHDGTTPATVNRLSSDGTNTSLAADTFNISSSAAFMPQALLEASVNGSSGPYFIGKKYRTGAANNGAVQVNDNLGTFLFSGKDQSGNYQNGSFIVSKVASVGASTVVGDLEFAPGGVTTLVLTTTEAILTACKFVPAAPSTSRAPINLLTGSAPSSPVDGDIWREDNTNTGLKIRINGVTKTITVS